MLNFYDSILVYFLIFFDNFSTYISAHFFPFGFYPFSSWLNRIIKQFQLNVLLPFVSGTVCKFIVLLCLCMWMWRSEYYFSWHFPQSCCMRLFWARAKPTGTLRERITFCTYHILFFTQKISLYYIDELIPSSKKFCSIYSPHQ